MKTMENLVYLYNNKRMDILQLYILRETGSRAMKADMM